MSGVDAISIKCKISLLTCALLFILFSRADAHFNSPEIFHEGNAGPYKLIVTILPPPAIPGIAQVEVRSETSEVSGVKVYAFPLSGPGSRILPRPEAAVRSREDAQFFIAQPWMMRPGSWQILVEAEGARGTGKLSIPVAALPQRTADLSRGKSVSFLAFGLLLFTGALSIVGAAMRESHLEPGFVPGPAEVRRGRKAMVITAVILILAILYVANWGYNYAARYRGRLYKPLQLRAALQEGANNLLLTLPEPAENGGRIVDDLIPDHNYLMHLFLIRTPSMDQIFHLHPRQQKAGSFSQSLPVVPAGRYRIFADIVHEDGLAETAVGQIDMPAITGLSLTGDDSGASTVPLSQGGNISKLSDGSQMKWIQPDKPLKVKTPVHFRFVIEDPAGSPAHQLQPYMGMAGHAMFVRSDFSVFAHVHPYSSVPMASLQVAEAGVDPTAIDPHAYHRMQPSSEVTFVYGFPTAGEYRIFVQVKRNGEVQTGVFDAVVKD